MIWVCFYFNWSFLVVDILVFLKHLVLPNNSIIFQLQSGFFFLSIFWLGSFFAFTGTVKLLG
jgi:hypothetical protein